MFCKADVNNVVNEAKGTPETSTPVINITNTSSNVNTANAGGIGIPHKSKMTALILCFFLGVLGVHRFYVGKTGSGIVWLFTGGLCGIGALVDFVVILLGNFTDKFGRPLV